MNPDDTVSEFGESTTDVRVRHAWTHSEEPSTAIIEAVAAATNRDPTTMPPLYEYINVDALNSLLTSRPPNTENVTTVSFSYEDATVQLDSSGWIEIKVHPTRRG